MDLMEIRRELLAQMAQGLNLPSNVEVKTFTLDADVTGSQNITIPNPFGRTDMDRIIAINFASNPTDGYCIAFLLNPSRGISDNDFNRKFYSSNGYIRLSQYYAIVSMTSESIVIRNSGTYNFSKGTYYMFAW